MMCPNDVLECPDGMSLERNPENGCEFGDCPADDGNNNAGGGEAKDDVIEVVDDGDMHRNESVARNYDDVMIDEDEDDDDSARSAWIAHGTIGVLVFGLLLPTSISSALFRDLMPTFWIYVHVGINALVFVMTASGVCVAVVTMHNMGVPYEGHMREMHHVVGLTLLMLVSFQTANGFLRPPREFDPDDHDEEIDAIDADASPSFGTAAAGRSNTLVRSRADGYVVGLTLRKMWQIVHYSVGFFVFALGIYQVHSGLGLYALRYSAPDYGMAYVGYVCWLIGIIACARIWMACRRRKTIPNFSE